MTAIGRAEVMFGLPTNPSQPRLTNSIQMSDASKTNAQKLIESLVPVGTNLEGTPIVCLKADPYLGKFLVKQQFKLSLGVPTTLTTLHDTESGRLLYTARDEEGHDSAEGQMNMLDYDCLRKSEENAKLRTASLVAELGFLGC